jgi:hypothetical protein
MKCQLLIIFAVLINFSILEEDNSTDTTQIEGFLLCKSCGADNSILNLIINNRISEQAVNVQNLTVSNKSIIVQELTNPLGVRFKVILTKKANCFKSKGGWYSGGSWFKNYSWKLCQCPTCKAHVGWMFELTDLVYRNDPFFPGETGFYGIILDSVISESYKLLQN